MKSHLWLCLFVLSLTACASLSRGPASGPCAGSAQEPISECRAAMACPMTDSALLEGAGAMESGLRRNEALNAHRLCIEQNMAAQRSSLR